MDPIHANDLLVELRTLLHDALLYAIVKVVDRVEAAESLSDLLVKFFLPVVLVPVTNLLGVALSSGLGLAKPKVNLLLFAL